MNMKIPQSITPTSQRNQSMLGTYPEPRSGSFFPEGLTTVLLLLALVACASTSVQSGDWERIVIPVSMIGVTAAIMGSILSKLNILDSIAHFISMVLGILVSFVLVLLNADELGPGLRQRVRPLGRIILDWYAGGGRANGHESYLVSILMGIIVWLVGYLAAWMLFRRGWLLASLALTGFLVLLNLLYAPQPDKRYLAAYLLIAIPLAARYHLYRRQREWRRFRMPATTVGPAQVVLIGTVIGIIITTAGLQAPASLGQQAFQPLARQMTTQVADMQARLSDLVDPGQTGIGSGSGGSYSSFSDSFSVGGALNLTDQPEVLVKSNNAPYLAAQRYDVYSGRGWSSDLDDTFDGKSGNGQSYSPAMTFKPNQNVMVSPDVTGSRTASGVNITQLTGRDRTIFTIDTYSTASIGTSVQMSWQTLTDRPFKLSADGVSALPPDLQRVATMLLAYRLTDPAGPDGPKPALAADADALAQEQVQLEDRFLTIRWTADSNGKADTLYVTGQVPVYDDVETVLGSSAGPAGLNYEVTGLASSATADELSVAGIDYPGWVTNRYLGLPDSVTSRTRDLAMEIAPASASPYERALAIQTWLRSNIAYDETVSAPPSGADMVDYLLFERRRGYCEYSASAMAVMLRAVNVPARVVTGFYPGAYDRAQQGYLYRQNNAHAWVEAFFPGYGWIQFEPTSSRSTIEQGDVQNSQIPQSDLQPSATAPAPTADSLQATATPAALTPAITDDQRPQPVVSDDGSRVPDWIAISGAIVVAVSVAGAVLWFSWNWKVRKLSPSSGLYFRLIRFARFAGVRGSPTATPQEFADAFAKSVPGARDQAQRIVHVYELDQYGPHGADAGLMDSAKEAWNGIRAGTMRVFFGRRHS